METPTSTGTVYYARKINRQERGGLPYESEEAAIYVQFEGSTVPAEIRERATTAYSVAKACVLDQLGIEWAWSQDRKHIEEVAPAPAPVQAPVQVQAPAPAPVQVGGYDIVSGYDVELPDSALAAADLGNGSPAWFSEALTFGKLKGQSWGALAQGCKTRGSDASRWCFGVANGDPALNADGSPKNPNYIEKNAVSTARARACLAWGKATQNAAPVQAPVQAPVPLGAIFDEDCPF